MPGSVGQYTQGWMAWQANKSSVGAVTRLTSAGYLGIGLLELANAQNNELVPGDLWLDTGVWKFTHIWDGGPPNGIATVQFNGVTVGTSDMYGAGGSSNNYSEITSISVTTAAVVTLKVLMATKNASASGYRYDPNSIAIIRTSGTASTPSGTDTPGFTWQYQPWMGVKSMTGTLARQQDSADLGGGVGYNSTTAVNDAFNWDIWLDSGTYTFMHIARKSSDRGIATIKIDGVSQGTIDCYAAGATYGVVNMLTGLTIASATVARAFQVLMASKNASSSAYMDSMNSISFARTGA